MRNLRSFIMEEDGMGTVEIVLIVIVLVGLVAVFKEQISGIVEQVIENIRTKASDVSAI
jgi:Flp pilus assembly pilin Flp